MALDIKCCFDQGGEEFPGISNQHLFNVAACFPFAWLEPARLQVSPPSVKSVVRLYIFIVSFR